MDHLDRVSSGGGNISLREKLFRVELSVILVYVTGCNLVIAVDYDYSRAVFHTTSLCMKDLRYTRHLNFP